METQNTLHGQTAAFIAAVTNAIGRNINRERMQELIRNPEDLKRLLLPLLDDEWVRISPILLNEGLGERLVWIRSFEDIQKHFSAGYYTVGGIVEVASQREFAFLSEERARRLAYIVTRDRESVTYRCLTGLGDDFFFLFTKKKKVFAYTPKLKTNEVECVSLMEKGFNDDRAIFFFTPGHPGSMEPRNWSN